MSEPRNRYSTVSLILHWVIAAGILAQVLLITAHEATHGTPISREYVEIHKSLGLTLLVLTLVRIGWRLANPALPLPDHMKTWEKIVARVTHVGFYLALLFMPLTGWAAMSARARPIDFWGLFNWPLLPVEGGREAARALMGLHELGIKAIYVLLALHVLGALKHHFVDRDDVLRRMLPFLPRRR